MQTQFLHYSKHIHLSHILFITLIVVGFFYQIPMQNTLQKIIDGFVENFDWFILLSVNFFLGLCVYLT